MAMKRGTSWRVETESVQGEGSWVEFTSTTLGEAKAARLGELNDDELILDHLTGWNWKDKTGKELSQPTDDPSVLDGLIQEETSVLIHKLFKGDPAFDPNA